MGSDVACLPLRAHERAHGWLALLSAGRRRTALPRIGCGRHGSVAFCAEQGLRPSPLLSRLRARWVGPRLCISEAWIPALFDLLRLSLPHLPVPEWPAAGSL